MDIITQNEIGKYELSEDVYNEIFTAILNIENFIEIINGYCEYYTESEKISHLLVLIPHIKLECEKISDKF